jgi:hypothetical protein
VTVEARMQGARRLTRTRIEGAARLVRLRDPVEALRTRPLDVPVTRKQLEDLSRGWANAAYRADLDYLELVCEHATRARSPVLECGSGLTTLLLALTAARLDVPVWTFEHDGTWYHSIRRVLSRFRVPRINLWHVPLVRYGDFAWYEVPLSRLPLRFGLVVCDGPPGSTRGGRRGLIPILGDRLGGATILVDDAERPSERAMLADWADAFGTDLHVRTAPDGGQVASLTIPDPSSSGAHGAARGSGR